MGLPGADSADDLSPLTPFPPSGEALAERRSEARSRLAARSLTRSSFVLPRSRNPSDPLSSEGGPARSTVRCAGQGRPSQLPRLLARSPARFGCPTSVELPVRACCRGQSTLTGWVVRLLVVSPLLLSGRLRVPGGGKDPPTTTGHTARLSCFFGSGPALSGGSVACLLLLASNTACLLHAGDPVPVKAARWLLLGGAFAQPWLASITGLLLKEARFPALGWGRWPLAQLVLLSRLVLVIVMRPVSSETRPAPIAKARACPSLCYPPPACLRASGWSVAALEARGLAPACLAAPSGATVRSIGDDLVPGAAAARSGKPSSEGTPSIVVAALANSSGCRRPFRQAFFGRCAGPRDALEATSRSCCPFRQAFLGRCAGPRGALDGASPRPPPTSSEIGGGARERGAGAAMAVLSPIFSETA